MILMTKQMGGINEIGELAVQCRLELIETVMVPTPVYGTNLFTDTAVCDIQPSQVCHGGGQFLKTLGRNPVVVA